MAGKVSDVVKEYVRQLLEVGYTVDEVHRLTPAGSISLTTIRRIAKTCEVRPPRGGRPPAPSFEEFLKNRLPSEEAVEYTQKAVQRLEAEERRQNLLSEAIGKNLFRIVMFDIETTHRRGDFGFILCAAFKAVGERPRVIRIDESPNYRQQLWNDRYVCEQILKEFSEIDILVTYYGEKFDLPFVRTRLVYWGLPKLPQFFHIDLYTVPRQDLLLHNNRLETLSVFLQGKSEKTHLHPEIWVKASHGDRESLDYVVDHCVRDVIELERDFLQLKGAIRRILKR